MQSVSSRIWTRVAVPISYDDNHYTTGTSRKILMIFFISASIQFLEQIICAWGVKHLKRLIFPDFGIKEVKPVYKSV